MNRIIKFRAWEPYNSRMVYEPYRFEPTPAFVLENPETEDWEKMPFIHYETWLDLEDGISRPCHIMQFTGLTDKNGKEIYESDIVRSSWYEGVVDWFWHGWHVRTAEGGHHTFRTATYTIEVIGNIYENPELLKP